MHRKPRQMQHFSQQGGIALLLGIFFFVFTFAPLAAAKEAKQEAKQYPPYPQVWGRELPAAENDDSVSLGGYPGKNGEVLIRFVRDREPEGSEDTKFEWFLLEFFEGSLKPIPNEEVNDTFRLMKRISNDRLAFADGGTVEQEELRFMGTKCGTNFNSRIVRKDKEGNVLQDRMLFTLYEKPMQMQVNPYCEISDGRDYIKIQFTGGFGRFVTLADATFLAYGERFVLRFDREMHSPFVAAYPKLFLVDTSVIEAIVEEADERPGSALQNRNDAILEYLLELKEKKKQ